MGYSTDFKGRFEVTPAMDEAIIAKLNNFADDCHDDTEPSGYCQWVPTEDGEGLEWDGNEKFYDYIDWLKFLINTFLAPAGYTVSGDVWWQGEEVGDVGIISVSNNEVTSREPGSQPTPENIEKAIALLKEAGAEICNIEWPTELIWDADKSGKLTNCAQINEGDTIIIIRGAK